MVRGVAMVCEYYDRCVVFGFAAYPLPTEVELLPSSQVSPDEARWIAKEIRVWSTGFWSNCLPGYTSIMKCDKGFERWNLKCGCGRASERQYFWVV